MEIKIFENKIDAYKNVIKSTIGNFNKKSINLGLFTGETSIPFYKELTENNYLKHFKCIKTFNLDEYLDKNCIPLDKSNIHSYKYFMNQHLFSKTKEINIQNFFPTISNNKTFEDIIFENGRINF